MHDFSLPLTVRRGPKVTSHVTKNPNNTGERGARVYTGKNPVKNRWSFFKNALRRWVFRFRFFVVFRGSCLATSNETPECEKNSGFFLCQCKRLLCEFIEDTLAKHPTDINSFLLRPHRKKQEVNSHLACTNARVCV